MSTLDNYYKCSSIKKSPLKDGKLLKPLNRDDPLRKFSNFSIKPAHISRPSN